MRRNVELKARNTDPEQSLATCRSLGAEDRGTLRQRDTYFEVPNGRLKLRDEHPGRPHLVQYERAEQGSERLSEYRLVEVDDAAVTREALSAALGVRGEVLKERRLFLWNSVRIHLDEVEGLGSFVEVEAVAADDSDLSREHALVAELREALRITDDRLVATGYADALFGDK